MRDWMTRKAGIVSRMFAEAGTEEELNEAEIEFEHIDDGYKCIAVNARLSANGRIMVRGKRCLVSGKMVSLDWCDNKCSMGKNYSGSKAEWE